MWKHVGQIRVDFLAYQTLTLPLQNNTAQAMRHSTLTGYLYFTLFAVPDTDYDNKNAQDSKPNERRYQFKHSFCIQISFNDAASMITPLLILFFSSTCKRTAYQCTTMKMG